MRRLLPASFPYETVLLTRRYIREPPAHRWLVRAPSGHPWPPSPIDLRGPTFQLTFHKRL